ncbi:hypothetical protein Mame01_49780 [Microbispora amethystogenes]|nr:hypothetical protein Mame01_49780 [Microbispora amethystogenes]
MTEQRGGGQVGAEGDAQAVAQLDQAERVEAEVLERRLGVDAPGVGEAEDGRHLLDHPPLPARRTDGVDGRHGGRDRGRDRGHGRGHSSRRGSSVRGGRRQPVGLALEGIGGQRDARASRREDGVPVEPHPGGEQPPDGEVQVVVLAEDRHERRHRAQRLPPGRAKGRPRPRLQEDSGAQRPQPVQAVGEADRTAGVLHPVVHPVARRMGRRVVHG